MAILQVLGTDKSLRLNDYPLLGLVNSFDWQPNFNATDVQEMGSTARVDTAMELETSGSFQMTSVGNTAGLLSRMDVKRGGASQFLGYVYDSGSAALKNAYTLTQADFADMRFDLVLHEKEDQVTFSRSLWMPSGAITTFSGSIDTNGMGMETYNFTGSFVIGFKKPFHDVRSIPAKYVGPTSSQLVDLTKGGADLTAVSSANNYVAAYAVVDGRLITNKTSDPTYVALGANGQITFTTTEGFAITADMVVSVAVYKSNSTATYWDAAGVPLAGAVERFAESGAGGKPINYVKAYQANIFLAPSNATSPTLAERWLRVQSCSWEINLKVESLKQIANNPAGTAIYAKVPTFPVDVTLNSTVTETDWNDWRRIMVGKTFDGVNVTDNTYEFAPRTLNPSFAVVIEYRTKNNAPMQYWRFPDLRVDGTGTKQQVGGRGEVTWTFKGTQFAIVGLNP